MAYKTDSAKLFINSFNPNVEVVTYNTRLDKTNIIGIVAPYQYVIDGCDNALTRYLVNDACVFLKVT